MPRPQRRCLGYNQNHCPALITRGSRCRTCRTLMYGGTWTTRSRRARAAQPFCTWCHTRENLSLDHVRGGSLTAGTQVLCAGCQNRKTHGATGPTDTRYFS